MPRWAKVGVWIGWVTFGLAMVAVVGLGWLYWQDDRSDEAECDRLRDAGVVVVDTPDPSDLDCGP